MIPLMKYLLRLLVWLPIKYLILSVGYFRNPFGDVKKDVCWHKYVDHIGCEDELICDKCDKTKLI